ncbi:MAG: diphthamide biosynthesis enzyme Dph2 [Thermoplasmata archaeon]|nr:diphthamide biosynthesis enzyme Dph2 [Thermoplasmata archaeon]
MTTIPAGDPGALLPVVSPPVATAPAAPVFARVDTDLFEALRRAHHRKLVLQVPAGLVRNAHDLAARISVEAGCPVVVATRPCFGACDFPSPDETPGVDGMIVLGHALIPNVPRRLPTYFVEMRDPKGDVERLAEIVHAAGLPQRLGLVASVQHLDLVPGLVESLGRRGHSVRVGRGDHRLSYAGQALGCNYTSAEAVADGVGAFLFLGTGRFHPLGLAFAVEAPVWSLDPLQSTLEPPIDRAALIRKRQLKVAACRDARRFGLLVSSFAGQDRSPMALALQRRARERGREAEIFVFDRLDARDLVGRDVDVFVNTACPRIALDDSDLYEKPMLTPPEFLMALGELPLEPYRFDTYH